MQEETGVLVLEKIVVNGITYYVIQIDEFIVLETYAELKKVYSGVKDTIESISQQENLHQLVNAPTVKYSLISEIHQLKQKKVESENIEKLQMYLRKLLQ